MKFSARKQSLVATILLFFSFTTLYSQVYYPVTHLTGSQSIGNRIVTVTAINNPASGYNQCGIGPYYIGSTTVVDGFRFSFSKPVNYVTVIVSGMHTGEIIGFYVNGTHYPLNSSQLFAISCAPFGTGLNSSGDLEGFGNKEIRFINVSSIDSIRVMHLTATGGGSGVSFKFGGDTTVVINEPVQDTVLCSLDSFNLAYTTHGTFKSGNVFTAQLSNASGSFASPVNIGSRTFTTSDTIKCQVPASTATGTGYRLRILSTNPVDTSDVSLGSFAIGNAPPVVNATANTPVCSGDTLYLSPGASGGSLVYDWAGPASFASTQQNPFIANAVTSQSGDYIITARLHGCVGKDTVSVMVNQSPAAVTAGSNSAICESATLNLSSTSGGAGAGYSWTGPASYAATTQTPSRTNTTTAHSGDYIVTATLNGCTTKDTVTVLVKPMPATPAATNNGPLCPGDSLGMTGNSTTAGVTYSWSGPASFTSSLQYPSILNVNSTHGGTYNVTASLNGCTSGAGTTGVTIKPTPVTPTAGSNTPVCAGAPLNLSATGTAGSVYSWTGPNGFTSNLQNPVIDPAALSDAGAYSVSAVLNGCPSTGTGSTVVVVNNVSSIGAYPSPNDTLCQVSPDASFIAVPNNAGSAPQYQWFKNGSPLIGATGLTFPATSIADGDTFHCRMTVTGLCSAPLVLYSNKIGITVQPPAPPPAIAIAASPATPLSPWQTVTFTATPGGNAGASPKYQWKRNGSNIIGATANTWSANNLADNDEISCEITSSEWCANPAKVESSKIAIHIKTGIDDITGASRYRVYPNPATSELTIEGETGIQVAILNMLGQQVYNGVMNSDRETINISHLVPGHYIVQLVSTDGSRSVVKMEKE